MSFLSECLELLGLFARAALAVPAGFLPAPFWRRWEDRLPISSLAFLSGVATLAIGFWMGVNGYLRYTERLSSEAVALIVKTQKGEYNPEARAPRERGVGAQEDDPQQSDGPRPVLTGLPFNPLAPLIFALTTTTGLASSYLFLTGMYRAVTAMVEDPRGDPVLSAVCGLLVRRSRKIKEARMRAAREAREGPEMPDLLLTGEGAGVPGVDYVVVASRRKLGWEPGVFVVTDKGWFRLGRPFERELLEGLRTFYTLTALRDHEALRRYVTYELPLLTDVMGAPSG